MIVVLRSIAALNLDAPNSKVRTMEIKTQLDEEHLNKLVFIRQQTNQDVAQVIQQAIDLYYQQLQASGGDPLAKFKRSKFIASFSGSPDLSTRSKDIFHSIMDEKYPRPQQTGE